MMDQLPRAPSNTPGIITFSRIASDLNSQARRRASTPTLANGWLLIELQATISPRELDDWIFALALFINLWSLHVYTFSTLV